MLSNFRPFIECLRNSPFRKLTKGPDELGDNFNSGCVIKVWIEKHSHMGMGLLNHKSLVIRQMDHPGQVREWPVPNGHDLRVL